jgi:phage gpG-like protein
MVEGMAAVMKRLEEFKAEVEQKQKVALALMANRYQNDVKAITPWITHTLQRSIHVEMNEDWTVAVIGTDLPYARRIEYGFVGKDSLGRTYNQAAQPYFRPPLENNKKKYANTFTEIFT